MNTSTFKTAGGMKNPEAYLSYPVSDLVSFARKDTLLVLLALVYSGNPAPERILPIEPQLVCLALFFGILLLRRLYCFISKDFAVVALFFAAILLVQCVNFRYYPVVTIAGFFVRLFIGYAVITVVKDFPRVYVRVMVGLAIISFLFYIPYIVLSIAGINVEAIITRLSTVLHTMSVSRRPLFFHTFDQDFSPRNFGMFWEPGAFQGYLVVALVFLAFIKQFLQPQQYRIYLFVLFTAVLTTMSTTGYILLALVILLHYDWNTEDRKKRDVCILVGIYLMLPLLIGGSILAYHKLPFLGEKIESQLDMLESSEGRWYRGRIGSLVFDWEYIKRRPLTGWGLHSQTRLALHPWMEDAEGMGNGFSDFLAKVGVLGFLTWFAPVGVGFWQLSHGNRLRTLLACIVILLLLQGERFLNHSLFLGLAFFSANIDYSQAIDKITLKYKLQNCITYAKSKSWRPLD